MEGLSSFHIDILMLSCLFDNFQKIITNLIYFAELEGPLLILIFEFWTTQNVGLILLKR